MTVAFADTTICQMFKRISLIVCVISVLGASCAARGNVGTSSALEDDANTPTEIEASTPELVVSEAPWEPIVETVTDTAADTPRQQAVCEPTDVPLLRGTTGSGFNTAGDHAESMRASVCKAPDGSIQLVLVGPDANTRNVLPACQKRPNVWEADSSDAIFTVVDERHSQRAQPGVLSRRDSDFATNPLAQSMQWYFETDIERTIEHQNAYNTPMCEGSSRLCTTAVGTNERLNIRLDGSTEADVVASIPGGSCAIWTYDNNAPLARGWINVFYGPGDSQGNIGFVSTNFVRPAPAGQVIDVHGVANVLLDTPWPDAIERLEAQLGAPDELQRFGRCNADDIVYEARWDNLSVSGHAPSTEQGTNREVLVYASVTTGGYSAPGGLRGGSTWGDFRSTLPSAQVVTGVGEGRWGLIEGVSNRFEGSSESSEFRLRTYFADIASANEVSSSTALTSVTIGTSPSSGEC